MTLLSPEVSTQHLLHKLDKAFSDASDAAYCALRWKKRAEDAEEHLAKRRTKILLYRRWAIVATGLAIAGWANVAVMLWMAGWGAAGK